MDKMSKWIVKYRNMILAVAIVLLIPSAIGYFNTNINYDLLSYLKHGIIFKKKNKKIIF